jgi:hypothetical protein
VFLWNKTNVTEMVFDVFFLFDTIRFSESLIYEIFIKPIVQLKVRE